MNDNEGIAVEFEQVKEIAIRNGWQLPKNGGGKDEMIAWLRYWNQMAEHDRKVDDGDTNPGRPVAPHRSA